MYVRRNIRWNIILRFAWAYLIFYIFYSTIVVLSYLHLRQHGFSISIPFLPVSTIGIAVAFYLGFKNNQSYDRFWEARKIWGGVVNASRTWGNEVLTLLEIPKPKQQELIYRHLAWINALRLHLRRPSWFSIKYSGAVSSLQKSSPDRQQFDDEVSKFLSHDEYDKLIAFQNMPTQTLRSQGEAIKKLLESGNISEYRLKKMMETLQECYTLQGKAERIKNTPFPRQYAYFSKVFTWIFLIIMPFGLLGAFEQLSLASVWLTVPFYVLIAWVFMTMELVGDNSEDPFENFMNDVPMTALCTNIEIDLREMLGETELPKKPEPVDDILM